MQPGSGGLLSHWRQHTAAKPFNAHGTLVVDPRWPGCKPPGRALECATGRGGRWSGEEWRGRLRRRPRPGVSKRAEPRRRKASKGKRMKFAPLRLCHAIRKVSAGSKPDQQVMTTTKSGIILHPVQLKGLTAWHCSVCTGDVTR